ncbi:glycoside hydrolase family 3 C-terminal domain-containing protein [Gemmatimonadota bacterium]
MRILPPLFGLTLCVLLAGCAGQEKTTYMYPFQDPDLPIAERVEDLVSRMTLPEKASQMMNAAPAIPRLGVPAYDWWNEALHGVARAGRATVFPQAIGLAATWDEELMSAVATVISDEARAKNNLALQQDRHGIYEGLTFWSPNINIFRDPRWGRGMETYGEDPYLTGRLAVRFVQGMQGDDPRYLKTVATPKHYAVHSGPEPDRHTFDARVDEWDLRETYLPAFESAVVEGGAFSVMCAYNRLYGEACCGSELLLQQILREEWGFQGYVVSDCGAIADIWRRHRIVETSAQAAAMGVLAGTDLNCGSEYRSLVNAVEQGLLTGADLDVSLRRLFTARFRLGLFDPPERVPYARIPYEVNDSPPHREMALQAARQSIVLLKNEGGALPLSREAGTIAVIGPNADDVDVLLGNYNGYPSDPVTILQGIRAGAGSGQRVVYEPGCELAENTPLFSPVPGEVLRHGEGRDLFPGLQAAFFDNRELSGQPVAERVDGTVDFDWELGPPAEGVPADTFSVFWEGTLLPPVTGTYALALRTLGGGRLLLDGEQVFRFSDRHVVGTSWRTVSLNTGRAYRVRIEYFDRRADAGIRFLWSVPDPDRKTRAIRAAAEADHLILVMGLSPRLEGEEMRVQVPGFAGGDRVEIGLPAPQQELIREIAALGKPTTLVLLSGSALAIPWEAANLSAIVEAWYPGQAAGTAVAEVLFGDCNPGGRLPVTFYASLGQLPPFSDYSMKGRTYRYFEGEPLFGFGHGLSYTTFTYSDLRVPERVRAGRDVQVSLVVENSGNRAGDEVVQVYLADLEASVPVPVRSLVGFQRIHLDPGQRRRVRFTIPERALSVLGNDLVRRVEAGAFEVSIGGRQPGPPGPGGSTSGVLSAQFTHPGGTG